MKVKLLPFNMHFMDLASPKIDNQLVNKSPGEVKIGRIFMN